MNEVNVGDMVKHCDADSIGIVKLIDGIAVWVHWFKENELNFVNCKNIEILQKSMAT